MRAAVVGHVEWIRFARVDHVPSPGEIAHSFEEWEQAGGAGAVAAVQLALLADEAWLFTVLGDDELGGRARTELEGRGVVVHAALDERPQRWAFTYIDDAGERTITTIGCPGTSSRRWTPSSSSPAMSTHSCRRGGLVC